ncbi:MAG: dual specificity protein phosphatase family protein [Planctomycetota bacterium]
MRPSSIKYAGVFGVVGCVLIIAAWRVHTWIGLALLVWVGFSFLVVAAAYATRSPRVLGKHLRGIVGAAWSLVLLPYRWLSELSLATLRWREREATWCEVTPDLLWGRRLTRSEKAALPATSVIDLTAEFPQSTDPVDRVQSTVPMLDGTTPSLAQLRGAVDAVADGVSRGPTYVHCAAGRGRSGVVVLGYLVKHGLAASVDEAVAMLVAVRPGYAPTRGHLLALDAYLNGAAD